MINSKEKLSLNLYLRIFQNMMCTYIAEQTQSHGILFYVQKPTRTFSSLYKTPFVSVTLCRYHISIRNTEKNQK